MLCFDQASEKEGMQHTQQQQSLQAKFEISKLGLFMDCCDCLDWTHLIFCDDGLFIGVSFLQPTALSTIVIL